MKRKEMKRNLLLAITGITLIFIGACHNPFLPPKEDKGIKPGKPVVPSDVVNVAVPVIIGQPQNAVYHVGAAAAAMTVSASVGDGGTLSYQWYSNAGNSNENGTIIANETKSSYTPPTTTAGTRYYYAVVTNTIEDNGDGGNKTASVVSVAAKITVSDATNPPTEETFTIVINISGEESGDTVTASPNSGIEGTSVTLSYTVADTNIHNLLDFGGVTSPIASVDSAESGTRTYTINADDASNGVITITAVFEHTDLIPDRISFTTDTGHINKVYGDAPFTNAVKSGYKGSGAITYTSSDTTVASVDSSGQVTIHKVGSTVISAEKEADTVYAPAQKDYTLAVDPKAVTITVNVNNKTYDGATTATVNGTAVIDGLVDGDDVSVVVGTAAFEDATAGNGKTVTFSGWSLDGADAGNYSLAQPTATANITKAPGAAVSQLTVNGSPTYDSITVNAVSPPDNGQTVEYAISTANNETGLLAWQSGVTFTGLNAGTTYYVYVRSASNTNYEAGTANMSAGIITAIAVTFNSNGGSSVTTQSITAGSTASRPTNPTRSDYAFDCWYQNVELTTPYNFNTPVNSNITLYARWVSAAVIQEIASNMVQISDGTFTMGQTGIETTEHLVTLSGFYMGKYQVTQEQYQAVMGSNPSSFSSSPQAGETQGKRTVERVSWYDALVFCNKLSVQEGLSPAYRISGSTDPADWIAANGGSVPTSSNPTWNAVEIVAGSNGYRLPTEAQWEYACRAGTTTAYNTGNTISDDTGWYPSNSGNKTHEVGLKPANAWGLYDMHGNVYEWCWDWYGSYSNDAQTDPMGASSGTFRVARGGSWYFSAENLRSAFRGYYDPNSRRDSLGFRLVRP